MIFIVAFLLEWDYSCSFWMDRWFSIFFSFFTIFSSAFCTSWYNWRSKNEIFFFDFCRLNWHLFELRRCENWACVVVDERVKIVNRLNAAAHEHWTLNIIYRVKWLPFIVVDFQINWGDLLSFVEIMFQL